MSTETSGLAPWERIDDGTFVAHLGEVVQRQVGSGYELGLMTAGHHRNKSGMFHGGAMAVLFDRVLGLNIRARRGGQRMATASLTVNFLRPVAIGDFVTLGCKLTKEGRKAVFGDAWAEVDGKVVATATGVFLTVDG